MKYLIGPFSFLFCFVAGAADPGVVVHSQSYVSASQIYLGDIADFLNLSSVQKKFLSQLPLGDAPAFGEKRIFSSQGLAEVLRSKIKQFIHQDPAFSKIKMQIPNKIIVENKGRSITQNELVNRLKNGAQENCSECEIRISDFRMPVLKNISPTATWEFHDDIKRTKGSFQVGIEVRDKDDSKDIYWITGRLQYYKSVPIATHTLNIGDRLREDDFKFVVRDVTFVPDASPAEPEMKGSQVKTTLSTNQVIYKSSLVRQPALSRGQLVMLTMSDSSWSVSLKGVAQETGYVGDSIKILNPDTKKIIVGRVVGDGVVEVRQ